MLDAFLRTLRAHLRSAGLRAGMVWILAWLLAGPASAAPDSKGTDFWLMFNANDNNNTPAMTLFITGDTATNGVVTVPGSNFSKAFSVTPGTIASVVLPTGAQVTQLDAVTNQGVHVVANAEVTVYGLNRLTSTTDAFLGLPVDILGTDYVNLSYKNGVVVGSQLGIVGTQAGTVVTITPTAQAGTRAARAPFSIVLNTGQTYQLRATAAAADLTGTIITSTAPIAVFGSHKCANVPTGYVACDHLVEQLPPTTTWGKAFATMPLATRTKGDTFRILASTDATSISINGSVVATLSRGQFHETILTTPSLITSTQPVLVAQYSNGTSYDGVTSDPFESLVPPYEQFLASYTVTTVGGFSINYVNVVVPNAAVGTTTIDGVAIPASAFKPIPGSAFSGAQRAVAAGTHTLASTQPFGATIYGFANSDSYGYPGGMSLSPVATVTTISVAPKTDSATVGNQRCITATLRDQYAAPVSGVRIDFTVAGANPGTGFATANASGQAQHCYTGTKAGNDTITAAVGSLTDSAARTWTAIATCDIDQDSDIDMNDLNMIRAAIGQNVVPGDSRDPTGDRLITINDVRACTLRCTRANCTAN